MDTKEIFTAPHGTLTLEQTEALLQFMTARDTVREAWDAVRLTCGEEIDHPCECCDGTGKDVPAFAPAIGRSDEEMTRDCHYCKGTGRKRHNFPWVVTDVDFSRFKGLAPALFSRDTTWVSIRPCGDEYKGKSYLGWLLGDIALMPGAALRNGTLELMSGGNPAIFVPELGKVIFGAESWWGAIKSPEDLRQISNQDINDIWYVQALKSFGTEPVLEPPPPNPLVDFCEKFIKDQRISCSETIYQTDRVLENACEFIESICEIVGYHNMEDADANNA